MAFLILSYSFFAFACLYIAVRFNTQAKHGLDASLSYVIANVFYVNSFMFFYMASAIQSKIENYRLLIPFFVMVNIIFIFKYFQKG